MITVWVFLSVLVLMLIIILCFRKIMIFPMLAKVIGILLMFTSAVQYAMRLTVYNTPFTTEHALYLWLFRIKLTISEISILSTAGLFLYSLGSVLFLEIIAATRRKNYLLLLLPLVGCTLLSAPPFGEYLYLHSLRTAGSANMLPVIETILTNTILTIMVIYAVLPYFALFFAWRKSHIYQTKKEAIVSGVMLILLDVSTLCLLFFSDLKYYSFVNLDLLKYPKEIVPIRIDLGLTIILVIFLLCATLILIIYSPFGTKRIKTRDLQQMDKANENIAMLLHTYKNAFCSICMFASDKNASFTGPAEQRLKKIESIAKGQQDQLTDKINMLRAGLAGTYLINKVPLNECIDCALAKVSYSNITLNLHCPDQPVIVNSDGHQMTEVLICLLNNAVEALAQKKGNKSIDIFCGIENKYAYITIADNGCGIEKKNLNKIFNPLYSSKKGAENYGIGLTYAKRIVEANGGEIYIKSKPAEYTRVQITLPLNKKENKLRILIRKLHLFERTVLNGKNQSANL